MSSDHDDFWGDEAEWAPVDHRLDGPTLGERVRGLWDGLLSGGTAADRTHGIPRVDAEASPDEYDLSELPDSGTFDDVPLGDDDYSYGDADSDDLGAVESTAETTRVPVTVAGSPRPADATGDPADATDWSDAWEAEPIDERRAMTIDPLLARMGAIAVVVTLLIPVVFGLSGGGGGDESIESASEPNPALAVEPSTTATSETTPADDANTAADANEPAPDPAAEPEVVGTPEPSPETTASTDDTAATDVARVDEPIVAEAPALDTPAEAEVPASRADPICAIDYEVVPGDFWIRLADGAGVPLAELLEANAATVDTPLFAGTTICLPAGSSVPPPPTSPPSTAAPATTSAPTTTPAPVTTAAPATTAAPTTVAPTTVPTTGTPTAEQVKQIIRDVWPDELEEKALEVAFRESRYDPRADNNFCCYGVFQIYWEVHKGWLGEVGIHSIEDLFDAEKNTRAAYVLYQRAGGWGPWGG